MILGYEWNYSRFIFPKKVIKALVFKGALTAFIQQNNK
ncbi:hypothetical protein ACVWV0_004588 [Ewingella americana]